MHQKIAFMGPNFFPVLTRKNVNSEITTIFFNIFTHLIYKMMQSLLIVKYNRTLLFLFYLVIQAVDFLGQRLALFVLFTQ